MNISSPQNLCSSQLGICPAAPLLSYNRFPRSAALSYSDSSPYGLHPLLSEHIAKLGKQFPIAGMHLSNPLVEIDTKVGEPTFYEYDFSVTTQNTWHGELRIYLHRELGDAEYILFTNQIADLTGELVTALRQISSLEDDLAVKSLLFPDPALVESLCYREGRLCIRRNHPFSVLFLSCDQFIPAVLRHGEYFAASLLSSFFHITGCEIRDYDFFVRYSHNEFAILLNNASVENAQLIAKRIGSAVRTSNYGSALEHSPSLSASIGITQMDSNQSAQSLLSVARHAMHLAYKRGGGQAVFSDGHFRPSLSGRE